VPAVAVRRRGLAVPMMTGHKGFLGGSLSRLKLKTEHRCLDMLAILLNLSYAGVLGIHIVAV